MLNEFWSCCLAIVLFSTRSNEFQDEVDSPENEKKLIGECRISLIKLFKDDIYDHEILQATGGAFFIQVNKEKKTHEKFWRKGNQIGNIDCSFFLSAHPFVRQHIMGVRTEKGQ